MPMSPLSGLFLLLYHQGVKFRKTGTHSVRRVHYSSPAQPANGAPAEEKGTAASRSGRLGSKVRSVTVQEALRY